LSLLSFLNFDFKKGVENEKKEVSYRGFKNS